MDEKELIGACKDYNPTLAFLVESELAAKDDTIHKLWISQTIISILAIVIVACICLFFWYRETQYEDIVVTSEQDIDTGDGTAVVAGVGDVYYGESKAESND